MQKILTTLAMGLGLSVAAQGAQQDAALLVYQVWEPGLDPYISRILVTPQFVRMDEGEGAQDYTLYDREQDVMYNISREDRSAMVMNPSAAAPQLPATLMLEQEVVSDAEAPLIAGKPPQNVTLRANGKVCREMVAVPGLMMPAMDGLRDFHLLLARIQSATLGVIPADMQTPCDLAENVYAPLRSLEHGLPIQERTLNSSRSLVDFVPIFSVDGEVFTIPDAYVRTTMPGLSPSD